MSVEDLRFESSEHSQGLCIALKATDVTGYNIKRVFAIVAERRMTKIMRESRNIDKIGVTAQRGANLPSDLRDLKGVSQTRSGEIGFTRRSHLRLSSESTQAHRMQHTSAIASELRTLEPLYGFLDVALYVCFGVAVHSAPRHGQLGVTKFGGRHLIHVRTIQPPVGQSGRSFATRASTRPGKNFAVGFLIDIDLTE